MEGGRRIRIRITIKIRSGRHTECACYSESRSRRIVRGIRTVVPQSVNVAANQSLMDSWHGGSLVFPVMLLSLPESSIP